MQVNVMAVSILLAPYYFTCDPEVERPYCLNYRNSSGELACTRFTYSRGRNDHGFYQNITGGRSSRNLHAFDGAGRIIRKFREYNDGETSSEDFHYDAQGLLVRETFENSNGVKGETSYFHNDKGQVDRMLCAGYKGWLHGELRFALHKDGRRLEGTLLREGINDALISYTYGSTGCLLKEHWKFSDGWFQTFQYVYEGA